MKLEFEKDGRKLSFTLQGTSITALRLDGYKAPRAGQPQENNKELNQLLLDIHGAIIKPFNVNPKTRKVTLDTDYQAHTLHDGRFRFEKPGVKLLTRSPATQWDEVLQVGFRSPPC